MTFEPHSLPSSFPLADDDLGVLEDERLPGLRIPFLSRTRLRSLIRTLRENHARGLVDMNERGEVVVDCSSRTSLPGFFAAGDVTTVPYKQIIVSAGEGAKAALAAYDYLVENQLV